MSADPIVVSVRPGVAPVVAVCDVAIGAIKICGVSVRRGRGQATYVNLPLTWQAGHWTPAVEIPDRKLFDSICEAVVIAAVRVNRPGGV